MTPKEYEKAVLERFRVAWPLPAFEVRHDIRLPGRKTGIARQVDVAIYAAGEAKPIMLVEAKRHHRPVDAGTAGSTIAMVQDIGNIPTIMVSTTGFSVAAAKHLNAEAIGHLTITITEAMALRWIPIIKTSFELDREFIQISGELVEALRKGEAEPFFDVDILYEEWCAVIDTGLSLFTSETKTVLEKIALRHIDESHRYNAIRILSEIGGMNSTLLNSILDVETDPEIIEFLRECTTA